MVKKLVPIVAVFILFQVAESSPALENRDRPGQIRRLTYSGKNVVQYPCLDDSGSRMIYILEIKDGEDTVKTVRIMNIEDGTEKELFREGKRTAPAPYQNTPLLVGSKPPIISGNGKVAIFSLSLGEPASILDHFLGVINTDGTHFRVFPFQIETLKGKDLKSLELESDEWERVSNYSVSSDGGRIACLLKGHLGPRRYGNPSGIVFLDTSTGKQRTILAPDFNGKEWVWTQMPRRPLIGGGWAFALSGNGKWLVFGAQSSTDKTDYDLYEINWDGDKTRRITDFHDRWFSLADISHDGEKIIFFYNGKKKQGIGTYSVKRNGSELKYLESKAGPRIDFFDLSGNGRHLLFKHIYKGMMLDLYAGKEVIAFDNQTPGYISGLIQMDFPRLPAFWGPKIMSFNGDKILLVGPPEGKETPEIYMLSLGTK